MNNNTMELNINEMEQVNGGDDCNKSQRVHRDPSTGSAFVPARLFLDRGGGYTEV